MACIIVMRLLFLAGHAALLFVCVKYLYGLITRTRVYRLSRYEYTDWSRSAISSVISPGKYGRWMASHSLHLLFRDVCLCAVNVCRPSLDICIERVLSRRQAAQPSAAADTALCELRAVLIRLTSMMIYLMLLLQLLTPRAAVPERQALTSCLLSAVTQCRREPRQFCCTIRRWHAWSISGTWG